MEPQAKERQPSLAEVNLLSRVPNLPIPELSYICPMTKESNIVKPYKKAESGKKEQVADMFNNISKTYDVLNRTLSLRIDVIWRKKAIKTLQGSKPQFLLDVATGTGDFALQAIKTLKPQKVIGVDISEGMLKEAKEKIKSQNLEDIFQVQWGDSEQLPFDDARFDAVTVAFGVRNFENLKNGLSEIQRVLKPEGKVIILEFSNPKKFPIKQLYGFYSKTIIPTLGKLISKDARAYSYLPESVEQFPDGENFAEVMKEAGFSKTIIRPQTFGICTIYEGYK